MQEQLNPLQQATWNCCSSLTSIVFLFFHIKPQLLWDELRWAQLHCLETAVSIMSAGTPLRSKSLILVLVIICVDSHQSNWKNNHELHRLLLLLVKKVSYYSIPATLSVQFVRPCPHTLGGEYCVWWQSLFVSFSFFGSISFLSFFNLYYRRTVDDILSTYHLWLNTFMQEIIVKIVSHQTDRSTTRPD